MHLKAGQNRRNNTKWLPSERPVKDDTYLSVSQEANPTVQCLQIKQEFWKSVMVTPTSKAEDKG
jgi:hypothetical protein